MCLKVFCANEIKYLELKQYALSLGSAFQKINFLRDIQSDHEDRGRVYFPNIDFRNFTDKEKEIIEKDIKIDFDKALIGIKKLPKNSKFGVYLAYTYYIKLFNKIKHTPAFVLKKSRIRISNFYKFILYLSSRIQLISGII